MSATDPTPSFDIDTDPSNGTANESENGTQSLPHLLEHRSSPSEPARIIATTTYQSQNQITRVDGQSLPLKHARSTSSVRATSDDEGDERSSGCASRHYLPVLSKHGTEQVRAPRTVTSEAYQTRVTRQKTGARPKQQQQQTKVNKAQASTRKHAVPRNRRTIPREMQSQWRVGAAPSVTLAWSREESQMSLIISQAVAFYNSMFEVIWRPGIRVNPFVFDLDNRVEVFRDSSVTAACLMAAGKGQLAQATLDRIVPSIEDLLHNPHPQFYLILAELALGIVKTPCDALRDQLKRYLAARALAVLGSDHPITTLLNVQLPQARRDFLGERIWTVVLPILAQKFGSDHYQTSTQVFCQARNMAAYGRAEDAVHSIETLIDRWAQVYGSNSLIVCYAKIELANVLVAAGSDMKGEFVVCDALRTSDIIHAAELRNEDCHVSERRHRESSIAFPQVAALRTLGRLHRKRSNFGAASHCFSQAVAIGSLSLGEQSAVVELAQDDLDTSRNLELKQAQKLFAPADLSNLTNIVASPVC